MKQPIFILSSLLLCGSICSAWASDSLDEEQLITESFEAEEPVAEPDNISISDAEYMQSTMDEIVDTRARIDELLVPQKTSHNLWTNDTFAGHDGNIQAVIMTPMEKPTVTFGKKHVQQAKNAGFSLGDQSYYGETVYIINNFLYGSGDNVAEIDGVYTGEKMRAEYKDCPFNTPKECAVWLRKPTISESVAPRSHTLKDDVNCDIASAIESNPNISANEKVMIPLLNRYKVLMRASQSCCTGVLTHKLKQAGAKKEMIYRFLVDDANFSGFGSRCVVMSDDEINGTEKYPATSATVADVRNSCICKSKTTIRALLAPFKQLYADYPEFADAPFEYQHYDGVGRAVTDSINADVQNVLNQLEKCP